MVSQQPRHNLIWRVHHAIKHNKTSLSRQELRDQALVWHVKQGLQIHWFSCTRRTPYGIVQELWKERASAVVIKLNPATLPSTQMQGKEQPSKTHQKTWREPGALHQHPCHRLCLLLLTDQESQRQAGKLEAQSHCSCLYSQSRRMDGQTQEKWRKASCLYD